MFDGEESWYFPELNREQAKSILTGADAGVFLVRVSSNADRPGPVISVSHVNQNGTKTILHFTVESTADGRYSFGKNTFPSLQGILVHYRANPLTDDGILKLTNPADVRYFAKQDFNPSEELARKVTLAVVSAGAGSASSVALMPVQCGQILRLLKRRPLSTPVSFEDGQEAKLWLMEQENGSQGLVPSTCLLIFVRSEYESFMQRQRQVIDQNHSVKSELPLSSMPQVQVVAPTPPPVSHMTRPAHLVSVNSPFSDRRLGMQSQLDTCSASSQNRNVGICDRFELPSTFPAKCVAILDRNPNFYDKTQLKFRKGDILTVFKPSVSTASLGVDDALAYGWSEACVDETGKRGFIPLFSTYIKWL